MNQEITEEIAYSNEGFYLHDGALTTQPDCISFIDAIRNCQADLSNISQQIWTCKRCANNCAIISCTDEQKRLLYIQNLTNIKMGKSSLQLIVKDGFVTFDTVHSLSRISDTAQLN